MGASGGYSKSNNQGSFSQTMPKFQKEALKGLYGQLSGLFSTTNNYMQSMMPGAISNMQNQIAPANLAWQNMLSGGPYKDMNLQNNLMSSLNRSLDSPTNMQDINNMIMGGAGNNYADAMKESYIGDANRATQNMLANLDARAAASGMSGGSRHGIATAQGMNDINTNLQRNLAETGYNTFDKDLDRKLNIAAQADQGTLARQQMMQAMLGNMGQTQMGGLNMSPQIQSLSLSPFAATMMPWQAMQGYQQGIGAPIVLTSGQMSGSSNSMNQSGGLGGGKS